MLDKISEHLMSSSKYVVTVSRIKPNEKWPELKSVGGAVSGHDVYVSETVDSDSFKGAKDRLCDQLIRAISDWIARKAKVVDAVKVHVHVVYRDFFTDTSVRGGNTKYSAELKLRVYVAGSAIQL